ncbi:hypothetical protein NDU88_008120 [Pleurodeles waltl]|uniref:Uncharacterized protein n=1 Tax=Pleurodeles waltl TaxID=8319 RepID=A0AAV7RWU2_PLEWA|nr:hypothetical protein NDU88_008120 [Pleurodeles waltl]
MNRRRHRTGIPGLIESHMGAGRPTSSPGTPLLSPLLDVPPAPSHAAGLRLGIVCVLPPGITGCLAIVPWLLRGGRPSFQFSGVAATLLLSSVCGVRDSTRAPRVESAAGPAVQARSALTGQGSGRCPLVLGSHCGTGATPQGNRFLSMGGHAHSFIRSRPPSPGRSGTGSARSPRSASSPQQRGSGSGPGPLVRALGSPLTSLGRRHLVRRPSLTAQILRSLDGVRALRRSVRFVPYGPCQRVRSFQAMTGGWGDRINVGWSEATRSSALHVLLHWPPPAFNPYASFPVDLLIRSPSVA